MEAVLEAPGAQEAVQCRPQPTAKDVSASCVDLTRAGSLESSQVDCMNCLLLLAARSLMS